MMSQPKAARELIAFYLDAGVDAVVDEEPVNRMAEEIAAARLGAAAPAPAADKAARRVRIESPLPIANTQAGAQRPLSAAAPA
ncbi:MAG: hypothetical protein J2P55_16380, partial [Rhizobiales bacterium]|nr:hypothetical protein [Hyphomicrobiales bacterium]